MYKHQPPLLLLYSSDNQLCSSPENVEKHKNSMPLLVLYFISVKKKACHHNHFVIMPNIFHQIKLLSTLHAPICTPSGKLVQKLINIALSSFPLPHSPLYSWLCTWRHLYDTTLSIQKMSTSSHTPLCQVAVPPRIKLHSYSSFFFPLKLVNLFQTWHSEKVKIYISFINSQWLCYSSLTMRSSMILSKINKKNKSLKIDIRVIHCYLL